MANAENAAYRVDRVDSGDGITSLRFAGELRFRDCFASWQNVRRLAGEVAPLTPDQIFTYLNAFVGGLMLTVSVVLFAFYWTIEGELGVQVLSRLAPLDRRT